MPSADDGTVADDSQVSTGPTRTRVAEAAPNDVLLAARGAAVGRYTILENVGAGATGIVYSAYDPELDRRVALKVIRRAHRRSRREAHAMAKLAHPNVVTIYDVGEHDGQLFLAMEFADDGTVADWLGKARPWREVLDVFLRAGRGLDAVHRAGLVHRDFKPANILLFRSGEVRVSDFGLARAADGEPLADSGEVSPAPDVSLTATLPAPSITPSTPPSLRDRLTRPGDLLGTPLYMAPEQHRGEPATPLSDQFAFGVALFEALYGVVPFAGTNRREMLAAMEAGQVAPTSRAPVPGWLRRVLVRSLAFRAEDRFPTMAALLAALQPRRRWAGGALIGLGVLGGAAALLVASGLGSPPADPCAVSRVPTAEVWNAGRRDAVRRSLLATGAPYAAAAADVVIARLDAWAERLRETEHALCVARAPAYPAQVACLGDNRTEAEALVDVLTHADAKVAGRAVAAAQGISSPESCGRVPAERDPWAPELAAQARRTLATMRALARAGRFVDALAMARIAAAQASVAADERTAVRALVQIGAMQMRADPKAVRPLLEEALWRSLAVGDDLESVAVLIALINASNRLDDTEAVRQFGRRALDLLRRTPDELQRAEVLSLLGASARRQGHMVEALSPLLESLAIRERLLPPDALDLASSYHDLGNHYFSASQYPEAKRAHLRALDIRLAALGPHHATVASTLTNVGSAAFGLGDYAGAADYHRRALAVYLETLPTDAVEIAIAQYNLGGALYQLGSYDEALAAYAESRRIYAAKLGPECADVVDVIADVADVHAARKQWSEALAGYEEAFAMAGKLEDPEQRRAAIRVRRSQTYLRMERYPDALADAQAADAVLVKLSAGAPHIDLATTARVIGDAQLALHRVPQGIAALERAVAMREALPGDVAALADVRFALARALADGDRPRARALARRARDEATPALRPEIDSWLAAHQ